MVLKLMKYSFCIFIFLLSLLLIFMFYIKVKSLLGDNSNLSLAIRWEGFYHDMNYRDLGKSINECYGDKIFNENLEILVQFFSIFIFFLDFPNKKSRKKFPNQISSRKIHIF